jgi:hypothetical protein
LGRFRIDMTLYAPSRVLRACSGHTTSRVNLRYTSPTIALADFSWGSYVSLEHLE